MLSSSRLLSRSFTLGDTLGEGAGEGEAVPPGGEGDAVEGVASASGFVTCAVTTRFVVSTKRQKKARPVKFPIRFFMMFSKVPRFAPLRKTGEHSLTLEQ